MHSEVTATTKMCSGQQRPAPRAPVGYYWRGPVAQPVGNSPRMCVVTAVGDVLRHMVCWATEGGECVLCLVCVGGWACDRHTRKYVRSCPAEVCRIACVTMACVQVRLAVYCVRCFGVTVPTGGVCVVGGGVRTADTRAGVPWHTSIWRELCVVWSTDCHYTLLLYSGIQNTHDPVQGIQAS